MVGTEAASVTPSAEMMVPRCLVYSSTTARLLSGLVSRAWAWTIWSQLSCANRRDEQDHDADADQADLAVQDQGHLGALYRTGGVSVSWEIRKSSASKM